MIGWGSACPIRMPQKVKPDGTKFSNWVLVHLMSITVRSASPGMAIQPGHQPSLPNKATNSTSLTFSWNGATEIEKYEVYGKGICL